MYYVAIDFVIVSLIYMQIIKWKNTSQINQIMWLVEKHFYRTNKLSENVELNGEKTHKKYRLCVCIVHF